MGCDQDKWSVVGLEGKLHLKELLVSAHLSLEVFHLSNLSVLRCLPVKASLWSSSLGAGPYLI